MHTVTHRETRSICGKRDYVVWLRNSIRTKRGKTGGGERAGTGISGINGYPAGSITLGDYRPSFEGRYNKADWYLSTGNGVGMYQDYVRWGRRGARHQGSLSAVAISYASP